MNLSEVGVARLGETRDDRCNYVASVASTSEEREEAYRIRYSVYVQEQRKNYPEADHEREWLTDSLDPASVIILVSGPSGPCGTVRASWADTECVKATYENQLALSRFSRVPDSSISICSRLAVLSHFRGTAVSRMLFSEIYRRGLMRNTHLCFETCSARLRTVFVRYGFREYLQPYHDPVAGILHRMVLVMDDLNYLESVRSPFVAIARQLGITGTERRWVDEMFEGANR